jgi:hypothetical protein
MTRPSANPTNHRAGGGDATPWRAVAVDIDAAPPKGATVEWQRAIDVT